MALEWKNQRVVLGEPSELTQMRLPKRLKAEVTRIAKANKTSLSAIGRYQLEKFVKDYKKNGGTTAPTLFD